MKRLYLLVLVLLFSANAFAVGTSGAMKAKAEMAKVSPEMAKMAVDEFLALTPAKYKEMTGERLGFKKTLQLKAAQKAVKKQLKKGGDITKGVYILLAILGLGWLAMGILSNWNGQDWIINLVLTVLCWLPGLIHAFIKMDDYY